jgi:hypothetical protein
MRICYEGDRDMPDIYPRFAVEATEAEAKTAFARLGDCGSSFNVLLSERRHISDWLMLRCESKDTWTAEFITEDHRARRYCTVTRDLAALLIEAAFRGEGFEAKIAFSGATWRDDEDCLKG